MAKLSCKAFASGWSLEIQTNNEEDDVTSISLVQALAYRFIETQTRLQEEGQRWVRDIIEEQDLEDRKNEEENRNIVEDLTDESSRHARTKVEEAIGETHPEHITD